MIDRQHCLVVVTPVYEDFEASSRLLKELAVQFGNDAFVVAVGRMFKVDLYAKIRRCCDGRHA